ncbi:hypothetical protein FBUS_03431 [Fasciolopsis buskii]|uniref:Protein AAR2 homolog n=1 Tax=Fasciolopsis buskii TaxID=27845 RepID=A0A8E0RP72_9TREM|nr:hypothetical protein FBUS_03431 [Fasciolopsis buski]
MPCLILRGVPENTELGIDMKFWRIGKNFRGIKEIPVGFHYVYYSAVNAENEFGQRTGFGIWISQSEFIVKQWNAEEEDFIDVQLTADDVERYNANFEEISLYLGPYPSECHRDWISLTSLITPYTLERLLPLCGRVQSCTQFLSEPSCSQQRLAKSQSAVEPEQLVTSNPEDLLPKLDVVPGTEFRFTTIPKNPLMPPNCAPSEVTIHSMDRSYTLESVLTGLAAECNSVPPYQSPSKKSGQKWVDALSPGEAELLAELQFSYVMFLLNHVMDGWNQWRRILQLVANCERAVGVRPHFYMGLITVLYHQLFSASQSRRKKSDDVCGPVDTSTAELVDLFFSDITSSSSTHLSGPAFLPTVMRSLLRNILCCRIPSHPLNANEDAILIGQADLTALQKRAEGFCHSLEQRFQWGLKPAALRKESEPVELLVDDIDWDGDEAPVIVQM